MRNLLIAGAAALLLVLGGAFAANHYKGIKQERNQLRIELAASQALVENLSAIEHTTSIVLSNRVQSSAAIQKRASNVQVEIEKRLAGPPACVLPPDWRVLHDAAASDSEVPSAPASADAAPTTPQEAASTVNENYGQYHDVADQLRALQRWVEGVSNAPARP